MRFLALTLCLLPNLAAADVVDEALDRHILPGFARLAAEAADLDTAARADCDPASAPLRAAYHEAFDAWIAVSHLRFGPTETGDRAFALAFWPDTKGATPKALGRLIAEQDPVVDDPDAFRAVSIAARGFYGLEQLLYGDLATPGAYHCRLVRAVAADIAILAAEIDTDWRETHAGAMRSAGEPGNATYLSPEEPLRALFTALVTGLEFNADTRLSRPLGSFDRPRPTRAEAWRSGRSLRHVRISLTALSELAAILCEGLSDEVCDTLARGFAAAERQADRLEDPVFAGVAEPQGRVRVEALKFAIDSIRSVVNTRLGPARGVSGGFNSLDGD